ncbi:response regulator transcription factor [Tessaracoccus antarcticus]|uniref:DNA-binding response regulator n=1 Tax=Tessaracoccus antarcticus TaxID=2479848 RepID=A0A3M0GX43_9ACTN|nr:response regulator transcription factor [Tessaracoccus antarcticus]RMB61946.1 DNA-binding response regulator [Tessaracoccus antarcticus]
MTAPRPISVAVLDDQEFICRALSAIADMSQGRITISRTTSERSEFFSHVRAEAPDVCIVDLMMDGRISGHEVIGELAAASVRCLAFTADHRRLPIRLAMQAGARGLVLKSDPAETLINAIVAVHEEGWAPSSAAAGALLDYSTSVPSLSPHELKCLRLAAEGIPVKAIGRQFEPPISLSSVKTYLARAYEKYSDVGRPVHNTTEAVVSTVHDGWFDL